MNREGYRDPTAEKAISHVMREKAGKRKAAAGDKYDGNIHSTDKKTAKQESISCQPRRMDNDEWQPCPN